MGVRTVDKSFHFRKGEKGDRRYVCPGRPNQMDGALFMPDDP